jgi:methylated-DNA-protein-cysteine methyltransferase-like protein
MPMNFYDKVYELVRCIPQGRVATYGQIAYLAGNPRASRAVGYALHRNPQPGVIPCHRVVNRFGRLAPAFAFGGQEVQRGLLENEGVVVDEEDIVDLGRYQWRPEGDEVAGGHLET